MKKLCGNDIRSTGSQKMTVFHGRENDKKHGRTLFSQKNRFLSEKSPESFRVRAFSQKNSVMNDPLSEKTHGKRKNTKLLLKRFQDACTLTETGSITHPVTEYKLIVQYQITADKKCFKSFRTDPRTVMPGTDHARLRLHIEVIPQNTDNATAAEMPLPKPLSRKNTVYAGIYTAESSQTHPAGKYQLKTKTDYTSAVLLAGNTE